jgi:hypothetical protein
MTAALTILIVGGYGIFGGRIVALLEDEPQLTLLVGGCSLAKASTRFRRAFRRQRHAGRQTVFVAFWSQSDCRGNSAANLGGLGGFSI